MEDNCECGKEKHTEASLCEECMNDAFVTTQ